MGYGKRPSQNKKAPGVSRGLVLKKGDGHNKRPQQKATAKGRNKSPQLKAAAKSSKKQQKAAAKGGKSHYRISEASTALKYL